MRLIIFLTLIIFAGCDATDKVMPIEISETVAGSALFQTEPGSSVRPMNANQTRAWLADHDIPLDDLPESVVAMLSSTDGHQVRSSKKFYKFRGAVPIVVERDGEVSFDFQEPQDIAVIEIDCPRLKVLGIDCPRYVSFSIPSDFVAESHKYHTCACHNNHCQCLPSKANHPDCGSCGFDVPGPVAGRPCFNHMVISR